LNGIEYVEIRDENTDLLGIIDTAQSIIWHSIYFGVGKFEIYVAALPETVELLKEGRLVTRIDNDEVGIIESLQIFDDPASGTMITASGRFAKSMLDRRLIYNLSGTVNTATILRGNVETEVRRVVSENAISCPFDSRRNIPVLALGELAGLPHIIVDDNGNATQKQVSYENLLTYTDALLEEYGLAAKVVLDADARKLRYVIFEGTDRSVDNETCEIPVTFSKEFDSLTASTYYFNNQLEKNVALIGGAGEGLERFYSLLAGNQAGLERRELFVDAGSVNRAYIDESEAEQTYTDDEYRAMLDAAGRQTLTTYRTEETLQGTVDVINSSFVYNVDFSLGDVVTMQSNDIGRYINERLRDVLERQDGDGYTIEVNTQM
jgi:hypothetical protein